MNERIREIISYYHLSDRQFAIKIGVTQSVIGSMFQKGTEPSSKVIQLTASSFLEISLDWFIRGKGEMFKSEPADVNTERVLKLVDTIATLQEAINIKASTIATLNYRIKQLETQISK